MKRINIGAGHTYIPGFINLDYDKVADIQINISEEKLPFESDSVDVVFSYHTLEHIPNYLFALSEIHRVLKHGGIFLLGVPYITSTKYNLVNPYHVNNFNESSFLFFDKFKGGAVESNQIYFKTIFYKCHYVGIFKLLPNPINKFCRNHLFNVASKIDFGLVAFKGTREIKNQPTKKELKKLFKEIFETRTKYTNVDKIPVSATKKSLKLRLRNWWRGKP